MVQWLRAVLFYLFGVPMLLVTCTVLVLLFWAPRTWSWAICAGFCGLVNWWGGFICGMKVVVEGQENLPDEPCVIMIKHTSLLETYGHVPMFPHTCWVVKREIVLTPIVGWGMGLSLQPIAIKRSAGTSSVKQVIRQGKERLASGLWVTIFPEGTRVPPGETRKYGVSGAALAKEANVPIVPVAHNAGDFWRRQEFVKRPGLVRFCIGPPISAQGRAPKETNLVVQDWIETKMGEISSEYQKRV
jgi:1-acyl-sn-glycerol-3-phosphate acyltransferase